MGVDGIVEGEGIVEDDFIPSKTLKSLLHSSLHLLVPPPSPPSLTTFTHCCIYTEVLDSSPSHVLNHPETLKSHRREDQVVEVLDTGRCLLNTAGCAKMCGQLLTLQGPVTDMKELIQKPRKCHGLFDCLLQLFSY